MFQYELRSTCFLRTNQHLRLFCVPGFFTSRTSQVDAKRIHEPLLHMFSDQTTTFLTFCKEQQQN